MSGTQLGFEMGEVVRAPEKPLFEPDSIRAEALALIRQARESGADGPWDVAELRYKRILFPHLVSWLPDEEERRQLCFAFDVEADRIALLLAA